MKKETIVRITATAAIVGMAGFGGCGGKTHETTTTLNPTETAIPTETVIPAKTPDSTLELSGYTSRHINPEEIVSINPNEFIMGDVFLVKNGETIKLCDDKPETGLIVDIKTPCSVYFKYGGDVRKILNPCKKAGEIEKAKQEMLASGKKEVNLVMVSKDKIQMQDNIGETSMPEKPRWTPKKSETPAVPPKEKLAGYTWKHINPGEFAYVEVNDFTIGDVFLIKNGGIVKLCDDKPETGLIVNVRTPSVMYFAYGGDVRTSDPKNKVDEIVRAKKEMLTSGIKVVDVIGINNTGAQKIQGK